jgi:choline dehydrogenase-like flavoprotein
MIICSSQIDRSFAPKAETIIVGSGPVGLILSLFLARRGVSVLLLEGGDTFSTAKDTAELAAELTSAPLPGVTAGRTRQVGGGLNLWGGQLASLQPCETQDWPIPLTEITEQFPEILNILGQPKVCLPLEVGQFIAESTVLREFGLDLIATAWLKLPKLPPSTWREIRLSQQVTLLKNAFVDSIRVDAGAVTGVCALTRQKERVEFTSSNVVLACGAIETIRLLLQKASNGSDQPWHALYWLGRGFNEHLDANTAKVRPLNSKRLLALFDPIVIGGTKYTHKIFSTVQIDESSSLSCAAMLSFPGNIRNSLAELRLLIRGLIPNRVNQSVKDLGRAAMGSIREMVPITWRYLRHRRISSVFRGEASLRISVEQPLRPRSRVTLSPTKRDSHGLHVARIDWQKGLEEGLAFREFTQRVKRWAETNGIAQLEMDPLLASDPLAFSKGADDGLHHAGGVRMAVSASEGVVNENLAVFGIKHLYCCGSSVFPRSGIANPTLTAMALAVRLGEYLLKSRCGVIR